MDVILASASPRRRDLIKKIDGLNVKIVPSNAEEKCDLTDPVDYAMQLAQIKAQEVFDREGGIVIGADTIVELDGKILGKPKNEDEAKEMFRLMCSTTQRVITGLCFISKGKVITDNEITEVTFGEYDDALVAKYIKSGAPFDKAGGYGIQDEIIRPLIIKINGDYDNVVGFPVKKVEEILRLF